MIDTSIILADAQVTGPQAQSANNIINNQGALNQEQSSSKRSISDYLSQKGQEVQVGELTVNGISSDMMNTDCEVLVILNGIKPHQPVSPTGDNDNIGDDGIGGAKDYAT